MPDTQQTPADGTQNTPETQQQGNQQSAQAAGKTFTQAELDDIVQQRLAREKGKYTDYDQLKKDADELKKLKAASQTEAEKLTNRLAELEKEQATWQRERQESTVRYEVLLAAGKLNIVDPDAAYRLLDLAEIEYDKEGRPTNVEAVLKGLVKAKPYLVKAQATPPASINAGDGTGSGKGPQDQKAREAELRARFRI